MTPFLVEMRSTNAGFHVLNGKHRDVFSQNGSDQPTQGILRTNITDITSEIEPGRYVNQAACRSRSSDSDGRDETENRTGNGR